MKKVFLVFISLILLFGITGCGNKNDFSVGDKSTVEVVDKYVVFDLDEETLTNGSASVLLRNDSEYNVSYGTPYELEIKENGEWHKINVELFFTLPLMNLKPGESENLEFNWTESYGKLAKGEYRIIKSFTVQSDIPERFYVAAEFTINE